MSECTQSEPSFFWPQGTHKGVTRTNVLWFSICTFEVQWFSVSFGYFKFNWFRKWALSLLWESLLVSLPRDLSSACVENVQFDFTLCANWMHMDHMLAWQLEVAVSFTKVHELCSMWCVPIWTLVLHMTIVLFVLSFANQCSKSCWMLLLLTNVGQSYKKETKVQKWMKWWISLRCVRDANCQPRWHHSRRFKF